MLPTGIVYCLSRMDCEKTADAINKKLGEGSAIFYHAGMDEVMRPQAQRLWQTDAVKVRRRTGFWSGGHGVQAGQ